MQYFGSLSQVWGIDMQSMQGVITVECLRDQRGVGVGTRAGFMINQWLINERA